MFSKPSITIYTHQVPRLVAFYHSLGFREECKVYSADGTLMEVEVQLEQFTIGISAVEFATVDHGFEPNLNGRPKEIALWTDDTGRDFERLITADGAQVLSAPHDWVGGRIAWVADPDGNPIRLSQSKRQMSE